MIRTSGVWRLESFYDKEKKAEFFATDENPYDYWPTGKINKLITKIKRIKKINNRKVHLEDQRRNLPTSKCG